MLVAVVMLALADEFWQIAFWTLLLIGGVCLAITAAGLWLQQWLGEPGF